MAPLQKRPPSRVGTGGPDLNQMMAAVRVAEPDWLPDIDCSPIVTAPGRTPEPRTSRTSERQLTFKIEIDESTDNDSEPGTACTMSWNNPYESKDSSVPVTICDLDVVLARLKDGKPASVASLLMQMELEQCRSNKYGFVSEMGKSVWANLTSSGFVDEPWRRHLWLSAAVLTLTVQLIPLALTRPCAADWAEDGTLVDMSVIQSLMEHPRYGATYLVQNIIYSWTAAALFTVHIDHRGRWWKGCMVQRWTWWYALTLVARAVVYWSLSWVVGACPEHAVVMFKVIEDCSNYLHILSRFTLNYLTVLKVWMLNKAFVAASCCALLCVSVALITIAGSLQLVDHVVPQWCLSHQDVIHKCLIAGGMGSWTACHVLTSRAMLQAAGAAESQANRDSFPDAKRYLALAAAAWTRKTAWALATAGVAIALLGITQVSVGSLDLRARRHWAVQGTTCIVVLLEQVANATVAAALSGLIGPPVRQDLDRSLAWVGAQVVKKRERIVKAKLQEACSKRGTTAAAIQSLVDGRDASDIFQQATKRFRRVQWVVLQDIKHLMNGGSLDGQRANLELYNYSEPCALSECDAFLSHSWHDDFELKWAALANWAADFNLKNGRYPTFWVDKFCINQSNVAEDLQCLPVFLAGCNCLLIIAGRTYTSRLWCVMELYVYVMMQSNHGSGHAPIEALVLGEDFEEQQTVRGTFVSDFAAENCSCCNPGDKAKIMAVIDTSAGGVNAFNCRVRELAQKVMVNHRASLWNRLRGSTLRSSFQRNG